MAHATDTDVSSNWSDTDVCPFCGSGIPDPGVGFINHIESSPDCESTYETWRDRVVDDMTGGWAG